MNLLLDNNEIMMIRKVPAALLALAVQHDIEGAFADIQGHASQSEYHQTRSALWRTEAARLQSQIDAGNFPTI